MRKIISAILLLAFFGQTFNQAVYYVSYLVDKSDYLKSCENKARPQLHCDGKCVLMRRIQEQEKKNQQQAPEMKLAAKAEALSSRSSFVVYVPALTEDNPTTYFNTNSGSPVDRPSSYFHPPGVLLLHT